ncbi:isoaspartyl peptidase/L-asparaginase-like [Ptiloglossa arizonensis]|uniref:isoaspartyl peptidase/L-asparaginase-like n=1 Tax=Ptiloglossa arizonensis TaxID=3350558 RepID=UPI003FA03A93
MQNKKYCFYKQQNNSSNNILKKLHKKIGAGECKCYEDNFPCIIVHGGAGNFSDFIDIEKMTGCKKAAINGYQKLIDGESSVNAVETALWWLECDEFFNCSYGSVLNELGISITLFMYMINVV